MSRSPPADEPADSPAPSSSLRASSRLGDFEIVEPLAEGGMGAVFRARQISLGGREVALKVLPVHRSDAASRRRFRREARIAAGIQHPHVVQVVGLGEADGVLYFAMALVRGPSLLDVLERRARALEGRSTTETRRVVEWIAQVASGLAALHARGIVHRDVKPSNIVLDRTQPGGDLDGGHAVLVDFGIARGEGPGFTTTEYCGATRAYAPPEQLLRNESTPAVDVFSLGATLHDLLACRRPQDRIPAASGLEPLAELVPEIDRDLAAIVAMARDPKPLWRYPDAEAMRADLAAWLAGAPVAARRPSSWRRSGRFARRHALVTVALGLGLIAIACQGVRAVDSVQRARAAAREGDVVAYVARSDAVRDSWLGRAFASFGRGDRVPTDDERAIAAKLVGGDAAGAWLAAATEIQRDGFAARPRLVEFLARGIADAAARPHALAALGRLVGETPIRSETEQVAAEPVRRAVVRSLTPVRDLEIDERRLLTALSGCGRLEDIRPWLPWVGDPNRDLETRRLVAMAAYRLAMRSIGRGERIPVPLLHEFENAFERGLPLALDEPAPGTTRRPWWMEADAVLCMGAASGFMAQHMGTPDIVDRVPAFGSFLRFYRREEQRSAWVFFFAARQDPRVFAAIPLCARDSASTLPDMIGDALGWSGAHAELGLGTPLVLGHRWMARAACADAQRTGRLEFHPYDTRGFLSAPRDTVLREVLLADGGPPPSEKDGDCTFDVVERARTGCVSRVMVREASIDDDESGSPFLSLYRIGESELMIDLDYSTRPPENAVKIGIGLLSNSRWYEPNAGFTILERIAAGRAVVQLPIANDVFDVQFYVPSAEFVGGRTQVQLRLGSGSTTTLRIGRISVSTR